MKKIIVSMRVENSEHGEERDCLAADVTTFFSPWEHMLIPFSNFYKDSQTQLERVVPDAILLTGGNDISPSLYRQKGLHCKNVCEARDRTEMNMISYAVTRKIPLFGICRGMQLINIFFWGVPR